MGSTPIIYWHLDSDFRSFKPGSSCLAFETQKRALVRLVDSYSNDQPRQLNKPQQMKLGFRFDRSSRSFKQPNTSFGEFEDVIQRLKYWFVIPKIVGSSPIIFVRASQTKSLTSVIFFPKRAFCDVSLQAFPGGLQFNG